VSIDLIGKLLALTCALLWALAVILFKRSGEKIPPVALNLYKTVVSAGLLLVVLVVLREPLTPEGFGLPAYAALVASGILGIAIADSLFFWSLNLLGAGLSAIVDCLYSPLVILLSWLMLSQAAGGMQLLGAGLVISGILVATLQFERGGRPPRWIVLGVLLGAAAMTTLALAIVLMKPVLEDAPILWVTEVRLVAAALALAVQVGFHPRRREMISTLFTGESWRHALPGSILGSFLAMILWIAAFKLTDMASAAVLNQMSTVFIVILASLLLGEPFTTRRLAAAAVAVAGSVLVILG
jgi:drug/metabolite transporter (DMT)-like permease